MQKVRFLLMTVCLLALLSMQATAQPVAVSFQLPLNNYPTGDNCLGWGGYNSSYPGSVHVADDACTPAGTDVLAVANGIVKFGGAYKSCHNNGNWGSLIIVEHTLPNGKKVCSIYGHTMPYNVKAGDTVIKGQHIGEVASGDGCWPDHIHFGMYNGPYSELTCAYNANTGAGSCNAHGYLPSNSFPGKYVDPVKFIQNYQPYMYDDAYSCAGPVTGGADTDWYYTCHDVRSYFTVGEPVTVMLRLKYVGANHRFKVTAYKDGTYQWEWSPGWNNVDTQWGWKYSHFWPTLWDSTPGNWQFRLYVDVGKGYNHLDDVEFTVKTPPNGYHYDYNATTCHGPVTGGWWTNWWYTCENPASTFHAGDTVYGLIRINNVWVDHSFKVVTYKNGVYQWEWSPGWNDVDENWGWDYSHFWVTFWDSTPANWQFRFYINTGSGYTHLDTKSFLVQP